MAFWLNYITYENVRALNATVKKPKDTIEHNLYRKKDSNWYFVTKIQKIVSFLRMLSISSPVVGVDTMIKQGKTFYCGRNL